MTPTSSQDDEDDEDEMMFFQEKEEEEKNKDSEESEGSQSCFIADLAKATGEDSQLKLSKVLDGDDKQVEEEEKSN